MQKVLVFGDYGDMFHPLTTPHDGVQEALERKYKVLFTSEYAKLTAQELSQFCAVLCYADRWGDSVSPELTAAIVSYVVNGGFFFPIHFGGAFMDTSRRQIPKNGMATNELAMLIGARFMPAHAPYSPLTLTVEAPDHPIAKGISDFEVLDEPFVYDMDPFAERDVILRYHFAKGSYPALWAGSYGNGKYAYLCLGHTEKLFRQKIIQQILLNAVDWGCEKG